MQRLKEAAEKAKIELSGVTQTNINLPFITADATGPKHLDMNLTRAKFDELTADLVEQTMGPTRQAMSDAGLSPNQIDKILLVGGSTLPTVPEAVKKYFGKEPFKGINPDECVAIGLQFRQVYCLERLKTSARRSCITRYEHWVVCSQAYRKKYHYSTKKSQIFSTAADGQTSIDIKVYQENVRWLPTKLLGNFQLTGIPPAPRGVPQIAIMTTMPTV